MTSTERPLILAHGETRIGGRAENQDVFHVGPTSVMVADGMGGHSGGKNAAEHVRNVFALRQHELSVRPDLLSHVIREAHLTITREAKQQPALNDMGSTVAAVAFGRAGSKIVAHVQHVGDSRAYLLRDGLLELLTKDHSEGQRLVDKGVAVSPQSKLFSSLNRALGKHDARPDYRTIEARPNDVFLVASDGLRHLSADRIKEILSQNSDVREAARKLVELADEAGRLAKGGRHDNITAVVARPAF